MSERLDSGTKKLQSNSLTISGTKLLFKFLVREFSETSSLLSTATAIIHLQIVERAAVKIQKWKNGMLSLENIAIVEPVSSFKNSDITDLEELSYAQKNSRNQ